MASRSIKSRVEEAALALLEQHGRVTPLDVLVSIGWVPGNIVAEWRRGKHESLEPWIQVAPDKVEAMHQALRQWAAQKGLDQREVQAITRRPLNKNPLGVTGWGDKADARFDLEYGITGAKRASSASTEPPEQVVFSLHRSTECDACHKQLEKGDLIMMVDGKPRCLPCLGLGHLVLLYSGNAKLTRRASKLSAVRFKVLSFARARNRHERIGIVVEPKALKRAEEMCKAE